MIRIATKLLQWGWSVVPVDHGEKRPAIPWLPFQSRTATPEETASWWDGSNRGIGTVCGSVSGDLAVLDFDEPEAFDIWKSQNEALAESLPIAQSSRGVHVFFRTPERCRSAKFRLKGASNACGDLLAEGKFVVLPPTVHPSGATRTWIKKPYEALPRIDIGMLGIEVVRREEQAMDEGNGVPVGTRHDAVTALALRLRKAGMSAEAIQAALQGYNDAHCTPALPREEVRAIAQWATTLAPKREAFTLYKAEPAISPERMEAYFTPCDAYLTQAHSGAEVEWLVEGFLPRGYLVVLGGTSKAGKSCFLTAMAMAVATGKPFLGKETAGTAVLWSCYEESAAERAIALRQYPDQPQNLYLTHEKPLIDTPEGLGALRYWIQKTGAGLLVVDPLYGANQAESLTDGKSARNALQGLKDLCNETGCTAVVIHHFTKAVGQGVTRERLADSNQITATASMDVLMDAEDQADGSRMIRLQCRGRGTFANQTWIVRSPSMTAFELVGNGQKMTVDSVKRTDLVLRALREGPKTAVELAEELKMPLGSVRPALADLIRGEALCVTGRQGRSQVYGLSVTVTA